MELIEEDYPWTENTRVRSMLFFSNLYFLGIFQFKLKHSFEVTF